MNNKRPKTLFNLVTVVFIGVLLLPTVSIAELFFESYIQITLQIRQYKLSYLNKVDVLTQKFCEDADEFKKYCYDPQHYYLTPRAALQTELKEAKAAIFTGANTTESEYKAFQKDNTAAILSYLESNPEVKTAYDDSIAEIDKAKDKIRVPAYSLMVIALAQYKLAQVDELMGLLQSNTNNPDIFQEQEKLKQKEWDAKFNTLFNTFDMSSHDYVTFMSTYGKAANKYLEAHPHIKAKVEDLTGQVLPRLQEYEDAKDNLLAAEAPWPELTQ